MTDLPGPLLAEFERAAKELSDGTTGLSDMAVDQDLRNWLDGEDEPLRWHDRRRVTADGHPLDSASYRFGRSSGFCSTVSQPQSSRFAVFWRSPSRNFRRTS